KYATCKSSSKTDGSPDCALYRYNLCFPFVSKPTAAKSSEEGNFCGEYSPPSVSLLTHLFILVLKSYSEISVCPLLFPEKTKASLEIKEGWLSYPSLLETFRTFNNSRPE